MSEASERIIVALDSQNWQQNWEIADKLLPHVRHFKIDLITAAKDSILHNSIIVNGGEVFIDAKAADIPDKVARISRFVHSCKAKMMTIHASCGRESIQAAISNTRSRSVSESTGTVNLPDTMILGVSILTSITDDECMEDFGDTAERKVLHFAEKLLKEGADAIVCSAQEAEQIRIYRRFDTLKIVTPGIRPNWFKTDDDQKRTTTPLDAIWDGADYLVIGRPITNPPPKIGTPVDAVKRIIEEVEEGLEQI